MPKNELSKKVVKRFSILYTEAKRLGLTDNDFKYITELSTNKYRVSVPNPLGKRKTKVVYDLLEAIKLKYQFVKEISLETEYEKEKQQTIEDAKNNITKYSTIKEGIEVYLRERKKDVERKFIELTTYERDYNDFYNNKYLINSKIYDKTIDSVNDLVAKNFVNYLYDIEKQNGGKLSMNTIYKPFSFIHKLFNYFKDDLRIIDYNPFSNVKNKPKAVATKQPYLSTEEIKFYHEKLEFENIRFRTFITLMLDSGLRIEEVLAIKLGNINRIRKTVAINEALVSSKLSGVILKTTKTDGSDREIILTTHSLHLIDKYIEFKKACGFILTDDDFLFTNWFNLDPIYPNRYSREWEAFQRKLNVSNVIPLKNLRTTNTTYFVSKGANLKAIQKHAGHSSFETTMKYYAQSNLDDEKKLVNLYEEEFYNKLGLSISDLYRIVSNRYSDNKKLINILENVCNCYIDDSNYDTELERCQNYLKELFPIFNKILKIDSELSDDELDSLLSGFKYTYSTIKIEPLERSLKI